MYLDAEVLIICFNIKYAYDDFASETIIIDWRGRKVRIYFFRRLINCRCRARLLSKELC